MAVVKARLGWLYTAVASAILLLGSAEYAQACSTQCCCGWFTCSSECSVQDQGGECDCECSCSHCSCFSEPKEDG
jgi:hypothetical protein